MVKERATTIGANLRWNPLYPSAYAKNRHVVIYSLYHSFMLDL